LIGIVNLSQDPVAGPCESGNEFSGSIKGEEFLDQLSNYLLLKKSPYTWQLREQRDILCSILDSGVSLCPVATCRTVLWAIRTSCNWYWGCFPAEKRPKLEAEQSPIYRAEVLNAYLPPWPLYAFITFIYLIITSGSLCKVYFDKC